MVDSMTVNEFKNQLEALPGDWEVTLTGSHSLRADEPEGPDYVFVFDDGRDPRWLTNKRWRGPAKTKEKVSA